MLLEKPQQFIDFNYPMESDFFQGSFKPSVKLNCQSNQITFMNSKEPVGFHFKFEPIINRETVHMRQAKLSNFQFRVDPQKLTFAGEYYDGLSPTGYFLAAKESYNDEDNLSYINKSDLEDVSPLESVPPSMLIGLQTKPQEEEEEILTKRYNYGAGIRTLKLVGGKPQEVEEVKSEDVEEEEHENAPTTIKKKRHSFTNQQEQQTGKEGENLDNDSKDFDTISKSGKL